MGGVLEFNVPNSITGHGWLYNAGYDSMVAFVGCHLPAFGGLYTYEYPPKGELGYWVGGAEPIIGCALCSPYDVVKTLTFGVVHPSKYGRRNPPSALNTIILRWCCVPTVSMLATGECTFGQNGGTVEERIPREE